MDICPICCGDRNKDISETLRTLWAIGIEGETVDPGGRVLWICGAKKPLRLQDQCNSCDEKVVLNFLAAPEKP